MPSRNRAGDAANSGTALAHLLRERVGFSLGQRTPSSSTRPTRRPSTASSWRACPASGAN